MQTNSLRNTRRFFIQWLVLVAALLVLGGVIFYSLTEQRILIDRNERERLLNLAKVIDVNISRQLDATNRALAGIREELPYWKTKSDSTTRMNQRLRAMSDAMPGVRTIQVLNAAGFSVASNRQELIGRNFSERDYFKTARQHPESATLYVSPPFRTVLGVFGINLARVITGPKGEFAGVVTATLDPEYFAIILKSVLYAPDMRASVNHGDGRVFLIAPNLTEVEGMDLAKPGSFYTRHVQSTRIASLFEGLVYATGDERMIAIRTVKSEKFGADKSLMVAVSRNLPTIFAAWRNEAYAQGVLFSALALAAILGLYIYQQREKAFKVTETSYVSELQENRAMLQSVINGTTDAVYVKDTQGRYVLFNLAAEATVGKCAAEVLGNDDYSIFPPDKAATIVHGDRKVMENGETATYEEVITDAAGRLATFLSTKGPLHDSNGQLLGLFGVARDITELKMYEEALRNEKQRLLNIVDGTQAGTWEWNVQTGKVIFNEQWAEIIGYTLEELSPIAIETWMKYAHPDDLRQSGELLEKHFQGEVEHYEFESRMKHKDGHWVWVTDRGRVAEWTEDGKPLWMFGTHQDITERKNSEEALRESEEHVRKKLQSILSPVDDISSLDLEDIIDVPAIQRLMDEFYELTRVPNAIIDLNGKVLVGTGWQDICTKFHRLHPETLSYCIECDTVLSKDVEPGTFKTYLCKNHLRDCVTPLIVSGQHVGNLFTGQFFFEGERPDDKVFLAQAEKYGFDKEEYIAALKRVPIWNRETIETAFEFYVTLANMITSLSHGNISLARNLEEQERAEKALCESHDMIVKLTAQVPGVVYQYRLYPDGRSAFPFASPGMNDIYEVTPEEVREDATPVFGRLHPDDYDYVANAIQESARTLEMFYCEFRVLLPRQGLRWRWSQAHPERTDDGGTLWHGIIADVTERKQAEAALRESAEKHRAILQTALDGFWLADTHGRLLEVNETYCQMSGYSKQELLTMHIPDLEDTEKDYDVAAHIQKIIEQGEDRFETRHRRKDGTIFHVESSVQYRPVEGGQFVVFIRDITERKQAEDEKRRFYRDTIKSITQGKLDLTPFDEVQEYLECAELTVSVASSDDTATARHKVIEFCASKGLSGDKLELFESAVGEALTNAIKHAPAGQVYAGVRGDCVWAAVSDNGPGMSTLTLPGATLRRGFSTKVSMGMGYSIMMEATDEIKLFTGPQGTTVVLLLDNSAKRSGLSLDDFQDTWDEIEGVG